jgi:signal transduction histidine kinase
MLARLQWSAFGLRGRIVGAVLVTAVATLVVATIVLLPQLERSLKTASQTTLQNDIKDANGEIVNVAKINYPLIAEIESSARGSQTFNAGQKQAKKLKAAELQLQRRLGTPGVALVGSIGPDGTGRLIAADPEDPEEALDQAAATGSLREVPTAFLSNKPVYSFSTVGNQAVVQAVIPLQPLTSTDAVIVVTKSIDDIPSAVRAVRRAFEIAALAGLILTILLAIPLAGTIVRRLQQLREAALRVAVEGAGVEFPVDRARDEVGDLARSFAIMQRRLRHQEEARRAFVATASHELRTPLASLDGMLELLADDLQAERPDIEDANALLERARAQSRRLGRLAADLLDLSRIDADVQLRSEPIELVELARAILAEFELSLRERSVTGVLHGPAGPPVPVWATGDPGSIARILRILVDNALRVAPPGSEIVIELSADPMPTVRVSDAGPGVAREERALIFERFKRGRDTGGEAGFGLGLAIGRELAERMDGSLVLADTPAPGATFVLSLRPEPGEMTPEVSPYADQQTPLSGGRTS